MEVWIFSVGENYEGSDVAGVFLSESAARKAMIARAQGDVDSLNKSAEDYNASLNSEDEVDSIIDLLREPDYTLGSFDPETVTCLGFGCDYYIIRKYQVSDV